MRAHVLLCSRRPAAGPLATAVLAAGLCLAAAPATAATARAAGSAPAVVAALPAAEQHAAAADGFSWG
ncbi:hypothetical protein NPS70_14265 [Streptomyces sp. C10-9-1]|uniref:hypothetical protein n=1 Tax=Streptomyces sp. C10-9-1 TaxID=1859285 RepID=UPI002111CF68|nr:hypothetical protein [Streptomyces sp. C10-9-1]MCQ6554348.1 hypothetical protein [Streptomyces sp. C10-9-1]